MNQSAVDGVVTFPEGLPGFEDQRQFMLVDSPDMQPFTIMQGVVEGSPSFVAIDPRLVERAYPTTLDRVDLARLAAGEHDTLLWLAIVAAREDGSAAVNLRAPVVINPGTMRGIQLIALESQYRTDHPLPLA
jgi:flagellar assembly factor FliW